MASAQKRGRRIYTAVVFIVLASLDNVAIELVPPLVSPISSGLHVAEGAVIATLGATLLVSAVASVGWGYAGDRSNRKPLLMIGTTIWAAGSFGTALSGTYPAFLSAQLLAAVGLGAVASVGYSVVTDLIAPRRRGMVMAFWGLSQGVGSLAGRLLGGLLGGADWRRPFYVITVAGLVATFAYLFTASVRRGASEPALAGAIEYGYRISRADLPAIAARRTNVWLVALGFTNQLAFGSLIMFQRLLQAKAEQIGYSEPTAIAIGSVYAAVLQLGGLLSILGGLAGDRLARRRPGGRALVAAVGLLAAIPLFVLLFFMPLRLDVPDGAGSGAVVSAVLASLVTEPIMAVSFLIALVALALNSANSPNWFALVAEVNPPEHRGTVFSVGNLVNGVGRSSGVSLTGVAFRFLERTLLPPWNFAVGLAAFQLLFIPTGLMYWFASRTSPKDTDTVQALLAGRAARPTQDPARHSTQRSAATSE